MQAVIWDSWVEWLYTYLEEHQVIPVFEILIRWEFTLLFNGSHYFISILEIVGAKNNLCKNPEKVIIERSLVN